MKIFSRLLCVARLLKLCRHSRGLRLLSETIMHSKSMLFQLVVLQLIFSIIFGSFIYYSEMDVPNSKFDSIPISAYWALFTMNTMGYADFVPQTTFGRCLGALCTIVGLFCISFPVPVIVSHFAFLYKRDKCGRGVNALLILNDSYRIK